MYLSQPVPCLNNWNGGRNHTSFLFTDFHRYSQVRLSWMDQDMDMNAEHPSYKLVNISKGSHLANYSGQDTQCFSEVTITYNFLNPDSFSSSFYILPFFLFTLQFSPLSSSLSSLSLLLFIPLLPRLYPPLSSLSSLLCSLFLASLSIHILFFPVFISLYLLSSSPFSSVIPFILASSVCFLLLSFNLSYLYSFSLFSPFSPSALLFKPQFIAWFTLFSSTFVVSLTHFNPFSTPTEL